MDGAHGSLGKRTAHFKSRRSQYFFERGIVMAINPETLSAIIRDTIKEVMAKEISVATYQSSDAEKSRPSKVTSAAEVTIQKTSDASRNSNFRTSDTRTSDTR